MYAKISVCNITVALLHQYVSHFYGLNELQTAEYKDKSLKLLTSFDYLIEQAKAPHSPTFSHDHVTQMFCINLYIKYTDPLLNSLRSADGFNIFLF